MNEKINAHVEGLFSNAKSTKQNNDIKEELIAKLNDKYNDLIAKGISPDLAFSQTISGIGDIYSLLGVAEKNNPSADGLSAQDIVILRQKRGIFVSVGVAMYILSICVSIFAGNISNILGTLCFFIMAAFATALIIYGNVVGGVKYQKSDDTFAEEYKEKISTSTRNKRLLGALSSALWTMTAAIYLIYSFLSHNFQYTWIIFVVAAVIQQILAYILSNSKNRKGAWHGILWTSTVVLYFVISFSTKDWSKTWLIFVVAAAAQQVIRSLMVWRDSE